MCMPLCPLSCYVYLVLFYLNNLIIGSILRAYNTCRCSVLIDMITWCIFDVLWRLSSVCPANKCILNWIEFELHYEALLPFRGNAASTTTPEQAWDLGRSTVTLNTCSSIVHVAFRGLPWRCRYFHSRPTNATMVDNAPDLSTSMKISDPAGIRTQYLWV